MKHYQLGEFHIAIDIPGIEDDNFSILFRREYLTTDPDVLFRAVPMDIDSFQHAVPIKKTGGYELLKIGDELFLMNHWATLRFGYGFYLKDLHRDSVVPVYCNKLLNAQYTLQVSRLLSTVGLHSKLLQFGFPTIHASYIDYHGHAILFTAPAQTGKSTQASLWQHFLGAEIINGDRVLLGAKNGVWHAYGHPCCGSSFHCINRTLPISAIVVLEQGPKNEVHDLSVSQKIRALVSATTLYHWDSREMNMSFSVAEDITSKIPVFKLQCRPDKDAVLCLKQYLEEISS